MKKVVDDKVKYGQDIPDFETLVSTLHDCIKTVHIDVVKTEEIETIDVVLPDQIKTFTGTMRILQYTWSKIKPSIIFFNSLSCFQNSSGLKCQHFTMGELDFTATSSPIHPIGM